MASPRLKIGPSVRFVVWVLEKEGRSLQGLSTAFCEASVPPCRKGAAGLSPVKDASRRSSQSSPCSPPWGLRVAPGCSGPVAFGHP